ncbi:putative C6 transcription factor [Aspergillus spinulosporus]
MTEAPKLSKRRGRIARSCDACYFRKIKCDTATPKCDWCSHHDLACTFTRLSKVPDAAAAKAPSGREGLVETFAPAFAHNLQLAGRYQGNICTFDGTPFFSKLGRDWIHHCTGETFHPEYLHPAESAAQLPSTTTGLDFPLPDRTFLYEEIQQYQASHLGLLFPVIDRALFDSTVDAAYCQKYSSLSPGMHSAKACIFALLALSALVVHGPRGYPLQYSDQYAKEAHRLLPCIFEEPVSLDGLQALLMLCLCAQGLAGDFHTVDQLLSAAARYACYLKGHVSPCAAWEKPCDAIRHTRTLFWIVYVCDKGLSVVTGLPPRLDDAQCDLGLGHFHHGDPYPGSDLHAYAHLAILQSRIQRELYSPHALQKGEIDLIRTIRDLDRELDEWKQSLKSKNQPSSNVGGGYSQQYTDMRLSVFQLQYYHCTVMIHQASSRCVSWVQNQKARGPGSSLAVAVTASRSLLQQFVGSYLALGPANLLFSISYFVQAIIVLFCNVLSNPLDESSYSDLQLIGSIPSFLEQQPLEGSPMSYVTRINSARKIISELERLAQCAIYRANQQLQSLFTW